MTDTKRQNAGGKPPVATPNIGPSGMVSLESALSGAIGARIRITTTLPTNNTLEGTLFTACPITNLIAINTAPTPTTPTTSPTSVATTAPPQPGTYHILPIPKIASFTVLSLSPSTSTRTGSNSPTTTTPTTTSTPPPTDFTTALPPIAPLDLRALTTRTTNAVARLKALDAKRGRGVGREGQEIFDALGRTLPTRWSEQSIVVLDAVVIRPPYRVEDCVLGHGQGQGQGQGQQGALGRVRKVLEMERKRIAERSSRPAVPAPAGVGNAGPGPGPGPGAGMGPRKGG